MLDRSPLGTPRRPRGPLATRRQRARLGPLGMGPLASVAASRAAAGAIAAGRDLSAPAKGRERSGPGRTFWLACAAGALGAALLLVQLRTESIDLRYRLARALQTEQDLLEERRRLIVERRQQRHPLRLAELGAELGLERPMAIRELPGGGAAR
jgi:hypothetical protein